MHYLIHHQVTQFPFLHTTPRKKQLKHQLINLTKGSLLVRLGKNDYLICAPKALWLPADCLVSVSYLPNCECTQIEISTRSHLEYPLQAGVLDTNPFLYACLEKLSALPFSSEIQAPQHALYTLIMNEITQQTPQLNQHTPTLDQLDLSDEKYRDLSLCLDIREAVKRRLSGEKTESILQDLSQSETFVHFADKCSVSKSPAPKNKKDIIADAFMKILGAPLS